MPKAESIGALRCNGRTGTLCTGRYAVVADDDDSHIQRSNALATEETKKVTQQVSHRPIKCQSRSWSQRGTKVNGSHHGESPLLKPTGIQIATKPLPSPTNRKHRKHIGVKKMSTGTNYSLYSLDVDWYHI